MNRRLSIIVVTLLTLCLLGLFVVRATTVSKEPADIPVPKSERAPAEPEVTRRQYRVIADYPHDRRAFTQGLVYENGLVYEGTGLHGQSAIVRRELETGKALKTLRLPDKYFGEGITIFGDRLIQLTWRSRTGFVYKKDSFTLLREFTYPTEGWGLTHDGKRLIMSDGSATLRFLDPNSYAETGRLSVRDRGRRVRGLNELEFIPGPRVDEERGQDARDTGTPQTTSQAGSIYANIWPTDRIAIIDPKTGRVTGWIDLTGLYTPPNGDRSQDVLNGIAWLPETGHLLVTGKCWPKLYEIELVEQPSQK